MASTGYKSPVTVISGGLSSEQDWLSSGSIKVSDDAWATCALDATKTVSKYLRAIWFAFAIPSTAVVNGIEVKLEGNVTGGTGPKDDDVILSLNGSRTGNNKGGSWTLPATTDAITTYGGPNDMWGTSLNAADINNNNFGIEFKTSAGGSIRTVRMDHFSMNVYYSEPAQSRIMFIGLE